jgi:hypothetical protein
MPRAATSPMSSFSHLQMTSCSSASVVSSTFTASCFLSSGLAAQKKVVHPSLLNKVALQGWSAPLLSCWTQSNPGGKGF